ncbi:hypothetical protein D5301_14670 [Stenotrophomonas sp. MH181796]|uniref:hypothetical protein n=1 Tax=Stenotrophomonas sp. MH181796 TaxID=2339228 RepID=UPI00129C8388|nr:hypothetical protein [Stenotrophomonas sp. MH181796]MRI43471.1 hypothetical protein [Stenotrophomonas sp. MH181796]
MEANICSRKEGVHDFSRLAAAALLPLREGSSDKSNYLSLLFLPQSKFGTASQFASLPCSKGYTSDGVPLPWSDLMTDFQIEW